MTSILINSLSKSNTYSEYRDLVSKFALEGKTTGDNSSESLIHYTHLNDARMRRLDKTLELTPLVQNFLENNNREFIWLVITESWCGDAAQILPVIAKMSKASNQIQMRIVLRDENPELMNLFLTNGTKSIPKLILIDQKTENIIADFGPRPKGAADFMLKYKLEFGQIDDNAKLELQKWYTQNKGVEIQEAIIELISR